MKRPELTNTERAEIARRYLNHERLRDIAVAVQCTTETVRRILKDDGVWDKEARIPTHDTTKQIQACLRCKKDDCDNCIGMRKEARRREGTVLG